MRRVAETKRASFRKRRAQKERRRQTRLEIQRRKIMQSKPSHTLSIVQIKAGEIIPETLLHKLLSENRSVIGMVTQANGVLDVEHFGVEEPLDSVEKELEDAKLYLEGSKKFNRTMCFASFPEKFDPDEAQPFVAIEDSKGNPILVVSIEGDFPGKGAEGMSEMYDVFHDYLSDKIEEMYGILGNDVKKLVEYLRRTDGSFKKDLDQIIGHRAVISFMPLEGEPFAHGENKLGGEYSWGNASNVYGYTESAVAAATPAKEEKPKRSKYADDAPMAPAPDKPIIPANDPPVVDPVKKVVEEVGGQWRDIPKNYHGKAKKAWIRDLNLKIGDLGPEYKGKAQGRLNEDWEKLTRIWVPNKTTVKALADLQHTAVAPKDMPAPAETKKVEEVSTLPVISGSQQASAVEFIKKFLDGSSNQIDNPLELQKQESKVATFSELTGFKLDDMDTALVSAKFAFCKSHPEAAALALIEYGADRRNRKQLATIGDKQLKDLTGTSPTDGTTKVETTTTGTVSPVHKKSKYA